MTRALLLVLLLLPSLADAQNLCTAALPAVVINPTQIVVAIDDVTGVTAVDLRAYPKGAATTGAPVASWTIARAALTTAAPGCYVTPIQIPTVISESVEHILTGHLTTGTTPNLAPWVTSENAFVRQPPPALCPPRPGEIARDGVRLVKITTTVAKLPALLLELRAQGWEYVMTGTATVYATTTCPR